MLFKPSPNYKLFERFFLRLLAFGEKRSMTPFLSLPLVGVSIVLVNSGTLGFDLKFCEIS